MTHNFRRGGIIYLTNNRNSLDLYEWICERENTIIYSEPINLEMMKSINPKLVVSYNYKHIVKGDVIDFLGKRIINLHISYLPWNRGSSPNVWSFIDNTPKGVTIHQMSAGLDQGAIIFQKELEFDISNETFESSYKKLNYTIVQLFQAHYDELVTQTYKTVEQVGGGSVHNSKDLERLLGKCSFSWDENIGAVLEKIHIYAK